MRSYVDEPISMRPVRAMGEAASVAATDRPILRWSLILPMLGLLAFWACLLAMR